MTLAQRWQVCSPTLARLLKVPNQIVPLTSGAQELLGSDVKARYADLKQASADRCPRLLGSIVKTSEIQFHHDVYNQLLWGQF